MVSDVLFFVRRPNLQRLNRQDALIALSEQIPPHSLLVRSDRPLRAISVAVSSAVLQLGNRIIHFTIAHHSKDGFHVRVAPGAPKLLHAC